MKAAFSPPPRQPPGTHAGLATDANLMPELQPKFDEPMPPLQASSAAETELPISPSLLQPMDSRTVEEVQNKTSLAEPVSTSRGSEFSNGGSTQGPTTPDQVKPETIPCISTKTVSSLFIMVAKCAEHLAVSCKREMASDSNIHLQKTKTVRKSYCCKAHACLTAQNLWCSPKSRSLKSFPALAQ